MGKHSKIPWTHHSFNPWWGCLRLSPACQSCYAQAFATRMGFDLWGADKPRRFFGDAHWAEPLKWNRAAEVAGERQRVFCASMADVFEDRPDLVPHRERLYALIDQTPWLDWLLLTKRINNVRRLAPSRWRAEGLPFNVWLGTTAETQKHAEQRIPILLAIPAVVRFVSVEPMLGALDLRAYLDRGHESGGPAGWIAEPSLDWVISGSESGHRPRPCSLDWVRTLRDQCVAGGTPFFWKQHIVDGRKVEMPELDGRVWGEFPTPVRPVGEH